MGIKEQLQAATSKEEVATLLAAGKAYRWVSAATRRKWARIVAEKK